MNRSLTAAFFVALLVGMPFAARAAGEPDPAPERARIASERAKIEGEFKVTEKACYQKFAVTGCINDAREKRREALGVLRKQEIVLNDAERRHRGEERVRAIQEKSSAAKAAADEQKRVKALEDQAARDARSKQKKSDRSALAASAPAKAVARQAHEQNRQQDQATAQAKRAKDAAENVRKRDEKNVEAAKQKQDRDKRIAERKKKLPPSLPTPP